MPPRIEKNEEESSFTKIGYFLILIAGLVELYLGVSYLVFGAPEDQLFGQITLMEGFFALGALIALDPVLGKGFKLYPRKFKKLEISDTGITTLVLFAMLIGIQMAFQMVPLTVRNVDRAMAIAFAGPAEEALFRGLMISVFVAISANMEKMKIPLTDKEISFFEIFGILVSATLWGVIHVNYYGDVSVLMAIFVSGIGLGFVYWWTRDLTACILAHFALNIFAVIQSLGPVMF